ncbi:MAG: Holliday junction resolvase RuvX, partial [Dehalococcoidales bacterium]|nr:Holliday junction resolvase RuvX [Dehalococcoidales bacterium]
LALIAADAQTAGVPTELVDALAHAYATAAGADDTRDIAAVVEEEEVEVVVVGLPRSLDGTLGPQAERVQRFADPLRQRLSVPVEFWDERLSTVAANRALEEAGVPARERRERIDAAAAALILQAYLDYRRYRNIANDAEED